MRLDQYLVQHELVSSRSKATDLIKRKLVTVDGVVARKSGQDINQEKVELLNEVLYVGRGGEKLAGAITFFHIDFKGKKVIDVGSSTGGFTDVSLKHGASYVYAYDVGHDQLDESLRNHPFVEVHESTNFLDVKLPEADIIVIDVSFISITQIMTHIKGFRGIVIGLIKPQFEVGKIHMKNGVLKDKKTHKLIIKQVIRFIENLAFPVIDIMPSSLKGKKGNQEYMIYIDTSKEASRKIDRRIEDVIC